VEELVDELFEDAGGEAHPGREDGGQLEDVGEPEKDRRRGDDGVGAVGPELVGVAPLAVADIRTSS
jgi:hypothetical protein